MIFHDYVIKWKHFPRYWPLVRGIHQSPVDSPQWRGALMFSLICACITCWANNRDAGDLRRHRANHCLTVMDQVSTVNSPLFKESHSCNGQVNMHYCDVTWGHRSSIFLALLRREGHEWSSNMESVSCHDVIVRMVRCIGMGYDCDFYLFRKTHRNTLSTTVITDSNSSTSDPTARPILILLPTRLPIDGWNVGRR